MPETTAGIPRFDPYSVPGSPLGRIMTTADRITAQRNAITDIRRLHQHNTDTNQCTHCNTQWPCTTIEIINRNRA